MQSPEFTKTDAMWRQLLLVTISILVSACAAGPHVPAGEPCVTANFTVFDQFDGARRGTCEVLSKRHVRINILPEDDGQINDSPWYGFRLEPARPTTATITLRYEGGHHRYRPKTSHDAVNWQLVDEKFVTTAANGKSAKIQITLTDRPVWLAAQELVTPATYTDWNRRLAEETATPLSLLGHSPDNHAIHYFDVNPDTRDVLLIIGRQHPPEVSGAFAFFAFAKTLFGDSELARSFRRQFRIIAIPLLNPDGVIAGNWRHNLAGVDLNRDWGPFTQTETQLVRDLLVQIDKDEHRLRLFIDFHSTDRNVFYTQDADHVTDPPGFARAWLDSSAKRIRNYEFANDERPVSVQANSKNFVYRRYGIPAVTYEVGDETDRKATQDAAQIFAEELMKLLLRHTE